MDVQVRIHGRNNERLETLKARRYPYQEQRMVEKMVPALYEAAKEGDVDNFVDALQRVSEEKRLTLSTIFNQVSPSGNSLLHVAASHESKEITGLIARHFPFLITKQNLYGDTPLHIAVNTTKTLINFAREFDDIPTKSNNVGSFLRIKNEEGNTALHMAVMICNHQKVQFLVMADTEVAYYQNNKGKSPLYLAAKTNSMKIFNIILQAIEMDGDSNVKLQGKSPMYAAIKQKNLDMLKEIVIKKRELMHYKDEKGRIPLHWAASTGFLEGVRFLLNELSDGALERDDKKGLYPIHFACKNGHVNVTEELLRNWPDPAELISNKGQNILHVAAKSGHADLVKFLLTTELGTKLLNKTDHDGNNPLHLATIHGHYFVVWSLARRQQDCLLVKNKDGLTAYDIADKQSTRDSKNYEHHIRRRKDKQISDNERLIQGDVAEKKSTMANSKTAKEPDYFNTMMALSVLNVLQLTSYGFGSIFRKLTIKSRRPSQEEINNRINTLMVVAALAAGATFGGALTMTGSGGNSCGGDGSTSNGNQHQTTPEWVNNITIPLFALLNTAALKLSLFTAVIILWAQLGDITLASIAVWIATGVLLISLYTMCLAFFVAVIIGLLKYPTIFFVVSILELLLVISFTIFSIPILMPIKYKRVFMLCITFFIFCFHYVQKRVVAKFSYRKEGQ